MSNQTTVSMASSMTSQLPMTTASGQSMSLIEAAVNCSYDALMALRGESASDIDALLLGLLLNCSTDVLPTYEDHTLPENLIEPVYEDTFSTVVGHFLLPVICLFGIVGILLTVIVLSQKNMTTSTNSYLLASSIADLLFLVMLITIWLDLFFERETPEQYVFEIYAAILTVFMQIFLTASIWLTVMLSIERYIAICFPYLAPKVCRVRRARIIIVCIYVGAIIVHLPLFFEYRIRTEYDEDNDRILTYMDVSEFATNVVYTKVYSWIVDGMIQSILPFLILLLLNTRLIWELRKSTKYIKRNLHVTGINYAQREELQVTLMLIIIVLVFFVCQAPYVIYTAIVSINHNYIESAEFTQFHAVTKLLLTFKAAANFILYCWFSERFLLTLRRLCQRSRAHRHCQVFCQGNDSSIAGYSSAYNYTTNSFRSPTSRQQSYQAASPGPFNDKFEFEMMLKKDSTKPKLHADDDMDTATCTPIVVHRISHQICITPADDDIHCDEQHHHGDVGNNVQPSYNPTIMTLVSDNNNDMINNCDDDSLSSTPDSNQTPTLCCNGAHG